jgi:hypothetical protein
VATTRPGTSATPYFARWLLFGTVLFLSLQVVVIRMTGEPYPAITMPVFPGAGSLHTEAVPVPLLELAAVFDDGSQSPFTLRELGPEIPESIRLPWFVANFGPDRLTPPSGPQATEQVDAKGWLPGRALMWRRLDDRSRAYWGRQWLAARCRRLFPSRHTVALSIRWMELDVLPDGSATRPFEVGSSRLDLPSSPSVGDAHRPN